MAYNTGTVISRVQRKLDDTAFDTATLLDFANDSQREILNRYRLPTVNEDEGDVTTTTGSPLLTGVPSDLSTPISLRIYTPVNSARVLPYVEYEAVDVQFPNVALVGNGVPIAWTVFEGVPQLINNADQTYTMKLKYIKSAAELTVNADIPIIPVEFSELLVLLMYARALEFNDEVDKATVIRAQAENMAIDLSSTPRQSGTPHIMAQPLKRVRRRL